MAGYEAGGSYSTNAKVFGFYPFYTKTHIFQTIKTMPHQLYYFIRDKRMVIYMLLSKSTYSKTLRRNVLIGKKEIKRKEYFDLLLL